MVTPPLPWRRPDSAWRGRRRQWGRILEIDPAYAGHIVEDLEKRNIHPHLIPIVVDGLRDAGLPVPERAILEK